VHRRLSVDRRMELIKQPERVEGRASQWKSALLEKA
jgi:hypothetical protein